MTGRLPEMHLFDFLHVDRRFSTQLLMTRDSGIGVPDSSTNRFGTIVLKLIVSSELSKRQKKGDVGKASKKSVFSVSAVRVGTVGTSLESESVQQLREVEQVFEV